MGNWGKPVVIFGVICFAIGILLMFIGGDMIINMIASISITLGAFMLFIGLPRLVKGANPKIYGKIMRPSSRARAAWMWALYMVNLMPLILPETYVLEMLNGLPPFPIAILASGYPGYPRSGYEWLLPVVISFFVIWVISGFLSGKYPNFVAVFFNTLLAISFIFWLNFGVYMFVWAFYENVSLLALPAMLDDTFYKYLAPAIPLYNIPEKQIYAFIIMRLPLALSILLFGFFMTLRMLRQLNDTFSNIEIKTPKMRRSVTAGVIISYLIVLAPLYFSVKFAISNHPVAVPLMNFAALIFIIIIAIKTATALINSMRELSRQKIGEGAGQSLNFGFTTALFIAILIISWIPIVMPLVDRGLNTKNNSAYNYNWNGWSQFREVLEGKAQTDKYDYEYEVLALQSSLSAISRLDPNKHVILVVNGPNKMYNPAAEIPFFLQAFNTNFSMMVCDDLEGQGFSLLLEMFIASLGKTPFTLIPKGVVMDNASYWKKPEFPMITNFGENSAEFTKNGVEKVVLSRSAAFLGTIDMGFVSMNMLDYLGWNIIGKTDGSFSYIDMNDDRMWDMDHDMFKLDSSITGVLKTQQDQIMSTLGGFLEIGIPLKGSQSVFATKELALNKELPGGNGTYSSRVFVASDASWLNNELTHMVKDPTNTNEPLFDNLQFGLNIIEWLSCGRDMKDVIIVFDESHIRTESGMMDFSSAGSFGFLHGYVNWLSTNPLISFFYPLFALRSLTNWIPKEQNKKKVMLTELIEAEKKKELLQFRTSSFFAKKINWYRVHKKYKQALQLLMRRIERKLHKMAGEGVNLSVDNIINVIQTAKGSFISRENLKRIRDFFTRMENLKNNKDFIQDEEDFQQMFLEMQWISDNL